MTMKLSPQDWETISAYLDGQLNQRERGSLETRLKSSAELRLALDEMRRIRTLLRSQPRLRAPRNFTLTPDMVAHPARRPAGSPWNALFGLRLTTAFASLVLLFVLVIDVFNHAPPLATSMNLPLEPAEAETMQMESFDTMSAAAPAPEASPKAGGAVEEPAALPEISLQSQAAPPPQATLLPTPAPGETFDSAATGLAQSEQPPADEGLARTVGEAPPEETTSQTNAGFTLAPGVLRGLEIGLAALAVAAWLLVIVLRRSGRG